MFLRLVSSLVGHNRSALLAAVMTSSPSPLHARPILDTDFIVAALCSLCVVYQCILTVEYVNTFSDKCACARRYVHVRVGMGMRGFKHACLYVLLSVCYNLATGRGR